MSPSFRDGHISLFNLRYGKLAIVSLFYYISKAKNQPCRRTYSSVKQINKNSDYFRFNLQLTIRNNLKFKVVSSSPCMRNDQPGPHLPNFSKTFSISTPKESLATNRNQEATKALNLPPKTYHFVKRQGESHSVNHRVEVENTRREGLKYAACISRDGYT